MSLLVVGTSRTQEDGVVSVPAKGSVTSGVSSVVNMVRSGVGRGRVGGGVGVTASRLGVPAGSHLETVQLILHLSGLPHQAGHSVDWQSLTDQG